MDLFSALRQIILMHTGTLTKEAKKVLEISLAKPVNVHRNPLTNYQTIKLINFIDSIDEDSINHSGLREKVIF